MKKSLSCILAVALLLSLLAGCGPATEGSATQTPSPAPSAAVPTEQATPTPEAPKVAVNIIGDDTPQASFAAGDIEAALLDQGMERRADGAQWTISFEGIDPSLEEQGYAITVSGKTISISGGDTTGLMYGGLEVAEDIQLYGIEAVESKSDSPYVKYRGMLCPVPMDMRTPSYNTPGTIAQDNIGNVWDIEFWQEYLDNLARNRMNMIQTWTVNSFASMVKVEGYEDVALDDVWRTTLPLDSHYKGDLTNAVRDEDWENYEVVKEMTIDEKIAFWQEVMAYAKDRGINWMFLFRHMYTIAEQGKYGIDNDPDNPVTRDYLGKSMEAFIETYPDVFGVGLNPGENMGWDNSDAGFDKNMQFLHDTYVPHINAALSKTPDREFQVMLQSQPKQSLVNMFSDLDCELFFTREYTSVHMYASSTPQDCFPYLETLPEGAGMWLSFRNEDNFDMRWGDPDFMIEFVQNMPADRIEGACTGSDGYFYGREYNNTDPDFQGQLYMKKHWYNYMLLGRLMYDVDMSRERIYDIFADHYENMDGTQELYEITSTAGKIIPQTHQIYFLENGDYTWFAAGCWSHPDTFGYHDIKRWMKSVNTYDDGNAMSIEEYALRLSGQVDGEYTTQTPQEISDILAGYGNEVLSGLSDLRARVTPSEAPTFAEKEFWALADDDEAMAYLGLYYSEKIMGAVELRVYNETKETKWQDSSVEHLKKAAGYFEQYAAIISAHYPPQFLARVGYYDINAILEEVKADVTTAENWKPRRIAPSYVPPSKNEYFGTDG